jgi:hypothetical protein
MNSSDQAAAVPAVGEFRDPAPALSAAVVICTYTMQRWELLRRAVASVHAQHVLPREIVLCVDHNDELLARCLVVWPPEGGTVAQVAGAAGLGAEHRRRARDRRRRRIPRR